MGAAERRTRNSHTHEYAWTHFLVSTGTHFWANEFRVQDPGDEIASYPVCPSQPVGRPVDLTHLNTMLRRPLLTVSAQPRRFVGVLMSRFGTRDASTLVVAEHSESKGTLSPSTLCTITAAGQLQNPVTVLVAGGKGVNAVAQQAAQVPGVSKVLVAEHAAYEKGIAENLSQAVVATHKAGDYSHILAPSSMRSKNYVPRVAALLDSQPITDVIAIKDQATFVRPMYAGNAIATVTTSEPLKILTVRTTAFEKAPSTGGSAATEVAPAVAEPEAGLSAFLSESVSQSARPELSSARVVISGGRGLKTKEHFQMLEALADKLKGAGIRRGGGSGMAVPGWIGGAGAGLSSQCLLSSSGDWIFVVTTILISLPLTTQWAPLARPWTSFTCPTSSR